MWCLRVKPVFALVIFHQLQLGGIGNTELAAGLIARTVVCSLLTQSVPSGIVSRTSAKNK